MPTIKELLSAKIDSEEKFSAITNEHCIGTVQDSWYKLSACPKTSGYSSYLAPWWLMREHFRIQHGVYAVSEALTRINNSWAAPYAVHISHDDDTMVAYTPSTEAGMADKQIKTTFGKFLRKTFITLSDAQIQEIEQSHRAELTAALSIATTRAEIEYVYRNMEGDSACMRHSGQHYGITNEVHPSHVYAAPGMGVAYVKVDDRIKSRAVVWTNPENESDKRFVRAYGDPVIKRLLAKDGYVMRNLAGARIAAIPRVSFSDGVTAHEHEYVVPYLDGVGGDQGQQDGTIVMLEGSYFRLITRAQHDEINAALPYSSTPYVALAKSVSAYVRIKAAPKAEFTSDLTGITYTGYQHKQVPIWLAHAKRIGVCHTKEVPDHYGGIKMLDVDNYKIIMVSYLRGTVRTFEHRYSDYVESPVMREKLGYRLLSTQFYGEDRWTQSCSVLTPQGQVLTEDAFWVLPAEGSSYYVHKSQVPAMRKQGYVGAVSTDGQSAIINRARPSAHRTDKGLWFCSSVHSDRFVFTIEDKWVAKASAHRFSIFGKSHYTAKAVGRTGNNRSLLPVPPQIVVESFKYNYMNIGDTVASVTPETCASTLVPPIVKHIKERLVMALHYQCGECLWGVTFDDDGAASIGQKNYGQYTWTDYLRFAKALNKTGVETQPTHDASEMVFMCSLIDALDAYSAPFIEKLGALMEQQALEAFGQLRIDTPALVPPTLAPISLSGLSEDCYALAA